MCFLQVLFNSVLQQNSSLLTVYDYKIQMLQKSLMHSKLFLWKNIENCLPWFYRRIDAQYDFMIFQIRGQLDPAKVKMPKDGCQKPIHKIHNFHIICQILLSFTVRCNKQRYSEPANTSCLHRGEKRCQVSSPGQLCKAKSVLCICSTKVTTRFFMPTLNVTRKT